jgi:hypothetical protein
VAALAVSSPADPKEHRPQAVMEALEEDLAHLVAVEPPPPHSKGLNLLVLRAEVLVPPLLETHLLLTVAQLVPEMDLFLNLEKP